MISSLAGLTSAGYIDHGTARIDAKRRGSAYLIGPAHDFNKPPKVTGTAKNDKFATAINGYISKFGGSINMLSIEKRIEIIVNFNDIGDPFCGYFMNGSGKWIRKGDAGRASIHPVHLTSRAPSGPLTDEHFEVWKQAMRSVGPMLERKKVTA